MQNSGIEQVIYLIEDYNIEQEVWAASVATAVSSTQVIDGFFVKRTNSVEDSVSYLKGMHDTIVGLLEVSHIPLLLPQQLERNANLLPSSLFLLRSPLSTKPST